jgi:serine/threonine protein kinase/Flp pilus assembly protein TadD
VTDESIFAAALAIGSPAERADYLDRACSGDAALRRQVDGLLAAHAADNPLDRPPADVNGTGPYQPPAERPGQTVGPYKLLQEIGEGGMGTVFMAEQSAPVRRTVAVKIIKPGMDSKQVVARFEAERQALSMMDHPNIARVLDAGATATGRPYFVMELVHGVPITEFCDANKLSPRQRLELFVPVCQAIQHAHQKGVIHRDIKPGNILVTMYDDRPVPKVIDFGVAKAVEQRLTERTLFTQFGTLVGTFEYMSPEQAEMNAFGVDTRSDVYSLGVLLYELLTGTTPLERQRLRQAALGEVVRLIKEEEPPRPSLRLSTSGQLAKVAAARRTEPAKLSALVRGELDWVVMRCLEKDRTRRYDTASALARDVERYLHDEPVEACPPTLGYRVRKYWNRNRAAIIIALLFLVMLKTTTLFSMWQANRASVAEMRAEHERDEAIASRRDAEAKAEELRAGSERMNEATAAIDLGRQHAMLWQWPEAEAAHNRAIALRPDHSLVWLQRGELYAGMGLWDLARADYARSFDLRVPDMVMTWEGFALLQVLHGDEAGYRNVCRRMAERYGGSHHPFARGNLSRACSLLPSAVPGYDRRAPYPDFSNIRAAVQWVGLYCRGLEHFRAGRDADAIRDFREALSKTGYAGAAMNMPVLAMALFESGDAAAAKEELANCRKVFDRWTQAALDSGERLIIWQYWNDWAEFLVYYDQAHRLIEGTPPPDDPRQHVLRGRALAAIGRRAEADAEYGRALRIAGDDSAIRKAIEAGGQPKAP